MKDEKEIQTAWEIWILINRLNDLLWNRYEEDFPDIDLQEEEDKFLRSIESQDLPDAKDKTDTSR
jgi:hypothetical protein